MAEILIRDIDESSLERLERRAAHHGRTLEAEAKLALARATQLDVESARALVSRIRTKLKGRPAVEDSTEIIRELRGS